MFHRSLLGIVFAITVVEPPAVHAENSFDGITCTTDIRSALKGRTMPNDRVVAIENRYKGLGLKDIGAFGMESDGDPWTVISWEICGREYVLLEQKSVVKDVLPSPLPPGGQPSQIATCSSDGKVLNETAIVFLEGAMNEWPKVMKWGWTIDEQTVTFKKIAGNEIVCKP